MALFTPGVAVAQISGRIGGQIFSHNMGGQYIRSGSIPTNPQSAAQTSIRAFTALNAANWQLLTPAEQAAWDTWAESAALAGLIGRLGLSSQLTGQQAFIRLNNRLRYAGLTNISAPPATSGPSSPTAITTFDPGNEGNFTVTIGVTPSPSPSGQRYQVAYTTPKGPGSVNFREDQLRLVVTGADATSCPAGDTEYQARFGVPPVGSKIGLGVRLIEAASGGVSPWLLSDLTVVTAI